MASLMRTSAASDSRLAARVPSKHRAARMVLRAAPENNESAPANTVFYGGQTYTEQEWQQAISSGAVSAPAPQNGSSIADARSSVTFGDVMAFSGPGPEVINGRLSMLGFVAAVAAEFSSGEGVLKQWSEEPTLIFLTFIIFIAASLVPLLRGTSVASQQLGPFTPQAEMLNGRAAMMGFAALLAIEVVKGSPLF